MKLDDLKTSWNREIESNSNENDFKEVIRMLKRENDEVQKDIARRDRLEIYVSILLIPFWIFGLVFTKGMIQSLGFWVAIVACLFIPYKLLKAKQVEAPKDDSLLAFLSIERIKIANQKNLLESIASWYLLPLFLAIVLITAGGSVNDLGIPVIKTNLSVYYIVCGILFFAIYFMNKRAAKTKFAPLLTKIDKQIDELNLSESEH